MSDENQKAELDFIKEFLKRFPDAMDGAILDALDKRFGVCCQDQRARSILQARQQERNAPKIKIIKERPEPNRFFPD